MDADYSIDIYRPDYNSPNLPASVKEIKPVVYAEAPKKYCCMSGKDPQSGIFGCGSTPEGAMKDWDKQYRTRQKRA